MKNLMAMLLLGIIALTISACGGGGEENELPPPTSSPQTDQGRHDVQQLAMRTRAQCQAAVMPQFVSVASQIQSGGTFTPVPVNLTECQNGMTQIVLSLDSLYWDKGGYQHALPWLIAQSKGLGNSIAAGIGQAGFPVTTRTIPQYFAAGAGMLSATGTNNPLVNALKLQALQQIQSLM